jgi:hypothetical protein
VPPAADVCMNEADDEMTHPNLNQKKGGKWRASVWGGTVVTSSVDSNGIVSGVQCVGCV